jgi:hypothetical protein
MMWDDGSKRCQARVIPVGQENVRDNILTVEERAKVEYGDVCVYLYVSSYIRN